MKKFLLTMLAAFIAGAVLAEETSVIQFVPTVAVLPFEGRGREFENDSGGKSIAELLSVGLTEQGVNTVERAELNKVLAELQLSAVGLVDKSSQVKIGRLTGAKLLIMGSIFKSGDKTFVVAKVIGTETSRVVGTSVNGLSAPAELIPELNKKVTQLLETRGKSLLPAPATTKSIQETLAAVQGKQRKVYVKITENINLPTPDPAAQTTMEKLLLDLGFRVMSDRSEAEYAVTGEAFAEPSGSIGRLVGAAARIELKITEVKDGKLLASGTQKERMAGASYQLTAKEAIAQAALSLAGELLPVLKQ